MARRLAIVGGDAAGMSAASTAKRRDRDLEVVAFERGPYTSYSACGIPYYLGGLFDDSDRLISRSPEEHRAKGIEVYARTEVEGIDLDARTLAVRDHQTGEARTEGFDELVLATGAEAVPPPIPGADATEPVRTVDAAERFRAALGRNLEHHHIVVIGGGYIGIEMAEALVQRDIPTTLVEALPQLMSTLDPDMATHVQDAAEGMGVRVLVGTNVEEILLDDEGAPRAVRAGGETIDADHVVMATGVKPAVALAQDAGIELGPSGAVAVDDHQRCPGHEGVYAAGDCAESWHRLLRKPVNIQLGTHANKQGRIAGANITGADLAFPGVIGTAVSRLCRYEVARTGLSEREAADAEIEVVTATVKDRTRAGYFPGAGPIWVKLVCEPGTGRLLGGQIVGVEGAAKRIDMLATCVWAGLSVAEIELLDLGYAPPYSGVYDPVLVAARAAVKALG
jgi:NADPH-dependent 2,4-dienoyl-CoA reductase/sulfur reductase-like enzyme